MHDNWRPDLSKTEVRMGLKPRKAPYFNIIQYCRHIGVEVHDNGTHYWVARVRKRDGGYRQKRIATANVGDRVVVSFDDALAMSDRWFNTQEIGSIAAAALPVGNQRHLSICPIGEVYTVGHALKDYLDWKVIAATRSHFETLVSLVNYHLVPRVSHIPLEDFDARAFHNLAQDVLETPPKYGRKTPTVRVDVRKMNDSQLRKRKKTFNALVSILRGAFEIAWERNHLESDRPFRCLRRLPNVDRPRAVFLDEAEVERLLKNCGSDLRLLVRAALLTGCRAQELTSLKVRDFREAEYAVHIANPKGRRTRYVILPQVGVSFFQEQTQGKTGSELIFRKSNSRPWGREYKCHFRAARIRAGLPDNVTFHGLRHTYASKLLTGGASLITVADQLGHANTQTVSATYGHLTVHRQREEVEAAFTSSLGRQTGLFVFRHRSPSSWPRSNHSKYSGSLLSDLRGLR